MEAIFLIPIIKTSEAAIVDSRKRAHKPHKRYSKPGSKDCGISAGKKAAIRRSGVPADLASRGADYAERFMELYNYWSEQPADILDYKEGEARASSFLSALFQGKKKKEMEYMFQLDEMTGKKNYEIRIDQYLTKNNYKGRSERFHEGFNKAVEVRINKEKGKLEEPSSKRSQKENARSKPNNKRKRENDTNETIHIKQPRVKRQRLLSKKVKPSAMIAYNCDKMAVDHTVTNNLLTLPKIAPLPLLATLAYWPGSTLFAAPQSNTGFDNESYAAKTSTVLPSKQSIPLTRKR